MCGITGLVHLSQKKVNKQKLQLMTNSIQHRGPDGEGVWVEKNIGIGHRRLSIIELSEAGSQPMHCEKERYVLSYNGEVYNFREIRSELLELGFKFKGNSDTEVVLNAFIKWGVSAFLKFNGMFALVLFDRETKELVIARDRYGIKPIYYAFQNDTFYFGSEQKAIFAYPDYTNKINTLGLIEYFTFQNFFSDQTLFNGIKLLPAGSYGVLKTYNKSFCVNKYWDYNFQSTDKTISFNDAKHEIERLFRQSVKRQLVSDVEVGGYLSGGMDSASITAVASKEIKNYKTFTCGFDLTNANENELSFDERFQAEVISKFYSTEHYEVVLKHSDMERCLPKYALHLEEPRVGQSYPNFYAAKLASKFVKVVLSGAGGDELFGGYPWRYFRASNAINFENYIDQYYAYWQRLLSNSELKKLFAPISKDFNQIWTRDIFAEVFAYTPDKANSEVDFINHSLYFEAKTFLQGLFIVDDKLSMSHSLETRVPFMDNDLVDFAMKCPAEYKIKNLGYNQNLDENDLKKKSKYFQRTNDGKKVLRHAMENILPNEVTKRKKQGFSAPDETWFRSESLVFIKEKLLNPKAHLYEYMDFNVAKEMIDEHVVGKKNRRLLIWSFLNIEESLSQFK